jgi:hypothetical protein
MNYLKSNPIIVTLACGGCHLYHFIHLCLLAGFPYGKKQVEFSSLSFKTAVTKTKDEL